MKGCLLVHHINTHLWKMWLLLQSETNADNIIITTQKLCHYLLQLKILYSYLWLQQPCNLVTFMFFIIQILLQAIKQLCHLVSCVRCTVFVIKCHPLFFRHDVESTLLNQIYLQLAVLVLAMSTAVHRRWLFSQTFKGIQAELRGCFRECQSFSDGRLSEKHRNVSRGKLEKVSQAEWKTRGGSKRRQETGRLKEPEKKRRERERWGDEFRWDEGARVSESAGESLCIHRSHKTQQQSPAGGGPLLQSITLAYMLTTYSTLHWSL